MGAWIGVPRTHIRKEKKKNRPSYMLLVLRRQRWGSRGQSSQMMLSRFHEMSCFHLMSTSSLHICNKGLQTLNNMSNIAVQDHFGDSTSLTFSIFPPHHCRLTTIILMVTKLWLNLQVSCQHFRQKKTQKGTK